MTENKRNLMSRYFIGTSYKDYAVWTPPPGVEYSVHQQEICPTTERLHIQWFLAFPQRKRLSALIQLLSPDHVEIARNKEQARLYCMKDQTRKVGTTYIETGVWSQGGSTLMMKLKRPLKELIEEFPWKIRQIKELKSILAEKRCFQTNGILLTGQTGKGKSKIANLIGSYVGEDETYWTVPDLQWFDGYAQERLMIVDEFRGQPKVDFLLRLTDRYPMKLPYKGGITEMGSATVVFTSNLTLEELYPGLDVKTLDAIKRRIKQLVVY